MATLFNRYFEYLRREKPSFDERGNAVAGSFQSRTVRGSVQPMNGKETVPAIALSRNTGTAKVYSSERLDFRSEDGSGLGYVRLGGFVYELVDELPNVNGLIDHWKYIACLVPPSQLDEFNAVNVLVDEQGNVILTEDGNSVLTGE